MDLLNLCPWHTSVINANMLTHHNYYLFSCKTIKDYIYKFKAQFLKFMLIHLYFSLNVNQIKSIKSVSKTVSDVQMYSVIRCTALIHSKHEWSLTHMQKTMTGCVEALLAWAHFHEHMIFVTVSELKIMIYFLSSKVGFVNWREEEEGKP